MSSILRFLQNIVTADRAPLIAGALAALTLLAAKFGLKLNASDTAYLGAFLVALASAFTHAHFASKPAVQVVVPPLVLPPASATDLSAPRPGVRPLPPTPANPI